MGGAWGAEGRTPWRAAPARWGVPVCDGAPPPPKKGAGRVRRANQPAHRHHAVPQAQERHALLQARVFFRGGGQADRRCRQTPLARGAALSKAPPPRGGGGRRDGHVLPPHTHTHTRTRTRTRTRTHTHTHTPLLPPLPPPRRSELQARHVAFQRGSAYLERYCLLIAFTVYLRQVGARRARAGRQQGASRAPAAAPAAAEGRLGGAAQRPRQSAAPPTPLLCLALLPPPPGPQCQRRGRRMTFEEWMAARPDVCQVRGLRASLARPPARCCWPLLARPPAAAGCCNRGAPTKQSGVALAQKRPARRDRRDSRRPN